MAKAMIPEPDTPEFRYLKAHRVWLVKTAFRKQNKLVQELFPNGFPEPQRADFYRPDKP